MMKKGDITSGKLIMLLILILGIAILLFIWYRLDLTSNVDRDACHQSIIERSTFNIGGLEPGKNIPLKCATQKTCIGGGSKECNSLVYIEENPVESLKISSSNIRDAKEEVLDYIAEEIYDCHSMLGEGMLDFMPHEFQKKQYCFICARFAFSEGFKNKFSEEEEDIKITDVYDNLGRKQDNRGQSYLNYVYGFNDDRSFEEILNSPTFNADVKREIEGQSIDIDYDKGYAIIAMVTPEDTKNSWFSGVAGLGLTLLVAPFTGPLSALVIKAGAGVAGVMWYNNHPAISREEQKQRFFYNPPTVMRYDLETLRALDCYFETMP